MIKRGAYRLSEPSCLTEVKSNFKIQWVTYGVSKLYNHIGRPQNREVNQQETKILKFPLSLLLFPTPDFRWMFQFSFSYFARRRSCFSFLRGKLARSRSELIPLRMPEGGPLFTFASMFRTSQGGGRSVTSQRTAVKRITKWKDDVFIRLYLSSNRANPQLIE